MKNNINQITKFYSNYGFNINIAILILFIISATFLQSRAFVVGGVVALLFCCGYNYKIKLRTRNIFVLSIVVLLFVFILSFFFKTDSSFGRMFIYKISWKIFVDNYLTGVGLGNFKIQYGLYQAKYFETEYYTQKEFLLADNVFYAFNDYWQFIIETGIVGFFFLGLSFYIIFKLIVLTLRANGINFSVLTIAFFIIIVVAALFTHVFEKPIFQLFIVVFFTWLLLITLLPKLKLLHRFSILLLLSLAILVLINKHYLYNITAYRTFNLAQELLAVGHHLEGLKLYEEIYPVLKDDVLFLKSYSEQLRYGENQEKALTSYLTLVKHRTDYRVYLQLGKIYQGLGKPIDAESAFLTAIHMVPNRFETRLALFNFYQQVKASKKARALAEFTLRMPVKIPSYRINAIKNELMKKIDYSY